MKNCFYLIILYCIAAPSFVPARADSKDVQKRQPISFEERALIIRKLNAERVLVKKPFPMGKKGLTIEPDGTITYDGKPVQDNDPAIQGDMANIGVAAKRGDKVYITDVTFKGNAIILEINGGPVKGKRWWQHIDLSSKGGTAPLDPNQQDHSHATGSSLTVKFKDGIPSLTPEELKKLVFPVLGFDFPSAAEDYFLSLPPIVQEAIKNHEALVGMDRDMVVNAKGRNHAPPIKEKDETGTLYEEWIYGECSQESQCLQEVQFIRFVGERVVRITIMKVTGEKVVLTERVPALDEYFAKRGLAQEEAQKAADQNKPQIKPTLCRPGENCSNPGSGPITPPVPYCTDNDKDKTKCRIPPPDISPNPPGTKPD